MPKNKVSETQLFKARSQAISAIEQTLGGERVITYIARMSIGFWDVLPIYKLLVEVGRNNNLNLILDSTGGYSDDAYKIADIFHEFCNDLTVIIPRKAKSAATLLSLCASKILMGPLSELGPCDPMISVPESLVTPTTVTPQQVPAKDETKPKEKTRQMNALALRDFLEAAGILLKDNDGNSVGYDADKLIPYMQKGILSLWLIGDFERSSKQTCQYSENLLCRYMFKNKPEKQPLIPVIAHKLGEGYFHHDYPIGRREAQDLGLEAYDLEGDLLNQSSELVFAYQKMMDDQNICRIVQISTNYDVNYWKS